MNVWDILHSFDQKIYSFISCESCNAADMECGTSLRDVLHAEDRRATKLIDIDTIWNCDDFSSPPHFLVEINAHLRNDDGCCILAHPAEEWEPLIFREPSPYAIMLNPDHFHPALVAPLGEEEFFGEGEHEDGG